MAVRTCKGHAAGEWNPHAACGNSDVEYVGMVLGKREMNGHDDSDFYALVWDAEAGRPREVCYASTRGWTYHNGADVDATPEVIAAAMTWYRQAWTDTAVHNAEAEARAVKPGRLVRSLTTRGKAKGLVGVVGWMGEDKYRSNRHVTYYRVGIDPPGGERVFLDAERVELVNPAPVDVGEIGRRAEHLPEPHWGGVLQSLAYARVGSLLAA